MSITLSIPNYSWSNCSSRPCPFCSSLPLLSSHAVPFITFNARMLHPTTYRPRKSTLGVSPKQWRSDRSDNGTLSGLLQRSRSQLGRFESHPTSLLGRALRIYRAGSRTFGIGKESFHYRPQISYWGKDSLITLQQISVNTRLMSSLTLRSRVEPSY